ncbi:hypothetical protein OE88DRAFT_1664293 [Heliocybe sulcata]|uniref:Uncharacterized protein n=1 Tax=Heliocybe sulcata TaxID=5364 RepID=A0A5C3MXJ6_9AGAM|nr:hypothetical protein OE88DRAFT_1664293 [Heliocybe sulcata]
MDSHYPPDGRYPPPPSQSHPPPPQQQQQQQQHHQWGPAPQLHLQVPQTLASSTFPSPVSPSPSISDYPHYYHPHPHHPQHHDGAALSLNLSGLSVASPTTVSPIHPSPHPSTSSTLSPITPLTPPTHAYLASQHGQFSFAPPYDAPQYDYRGSSRSSSCSEKSVPKKRSFSTTPLATSLEEHPDAYAQQGHGAQMDYEELDGMGYPPMEGSPVDGSTSSGEMDEPTSTKTVGHTDKTAYGGIPAGSINILGKPAGTNNFVTKLYQ